MFQVATTSYSAPAAFDHSAAANNAANPANGHRRVRQHRIRMFASRSIITGLRHRSRASHYSVRAGMAPAARAITRKDARAVQRASSTIKPWCQSWNASVGPP